MKNTIIIRYKNESVIIYKSIAEQYNLKHGQRIEDKKLFQEILNSNCLSGLAWCNSQLNTN